MHFALQDLNSSFAAAYLDDITLGGNINNILLDLVVLQRAASSVGLTLNPLKSEVFGGSTASLTTFTTSHPDYKHIDISTITLLSSPPSF